MSSSTSHPAVGGHVLRGAGAAVGRVPTPELRTGTWTRLGDASVLGDAVTEEALGSLATATRAAARAQGYAVGWAEGRRAARTEAEEAAARAAELDAADRARREQEHRAAVERLDAATAAVRDTVAAVGRQVEDRALGLARELTAILVGHELRISPDTGADAVRRALTLLPDDTGTRVRLHPDDAASQAAEELAVRGVRVVPDPSLLPGDLVVEADRQIVDARIEAGLDRVRAVLDSADGAGPDGGGPA